MSNAPLHVGCPVCSGSGQVSWLRSGEWLNRHCPGKNGPVDVDSSPFSHELDNYFKRRKLRVEYKHPGESVSPGQEYHCLAELESTAPTWRTLLVVVFDEGQAGADDPIRFKWRTSDKPRQDWADLGWNDPIPVGELGKRIAAWLWGQQ